MIQILDRKRLLFEIELQRKQLIFEGMKKGLTHADVINLSVQLDNLIIVYQRLSFENKTNPQYT